MKKFCIVNYKGGTGKTSTVVNMAHGMALMGKKVLLIDTDPQGSATIYLGLKPEKTLFDVLIKKEPIKDCIVTARENLDIICANEHLFPAEVRMSQVKGRELILSRALANLKGYDYVFVDCAPSMNVMNQNAILYSDTVLVPVSMEYLSLVGVKQLLKNIQIVNKIFGRDVRINKVIPTFYDKRNKKSADILESLNRVFPKVVSTPIRMSVSLSEAPGFRQTIFEYDPNSKGAEDYNKLINEVLGNG
jgi:chromosome partitioning protein